MEQEPCCRKEPREAACFPSRPTPNDFNCYLLQVPKGYHRQSFIDYSRLNVNAEPKRK